MKKKFFINILLLCLVLGIFEFVIYSCLKNDYTKKGAITTFTFDKDTEPYHEASILSGIADVTEFRPVANFSNTNTKGNTILFGDSFAYGASLKEEETFGYKLARVEKNTLYNFAYPGWGVQHMLYLLKSNKVKFPNQNSNINKIIYLQIPDHFNRLNQFYWGNTFENFINIRYRYVSDGKNKEIIPLFKDVHRLYIAKLFHLSFGKFMCFKWMYPYQEKQYLNIMKESHSILHNMYPDAKFYILIYGDDLNPKTKEKVEKIGWHVFATNDFVSEDLSDPKYHFNNDPHPSGEAWSVIVKQSEEKHIWQP